MKSKYLKKTFFIILINILIASLIIIIGRGLHNSEYKKNLFTSSTYKVDNETTVTVYELINPISFDEIRNQLKTEDWIESYIQSRINTSDSYSSFKKYTTEDYQKYTANSLSDYDKQKRLSNKFQSKLLYWIIESGKNYHALYTVENVKPYQAVQFSNASRFFILDTNIWKASPDDSLSKIKKIGINNLNKLKLELGALSNF